MTDSSMSSLLLKRVHSLLGIFPVGAFLLQHFYSNSYAFISPEAYNEHSAFLVSLPLVYFLEIGFIYLPILFHAVFGLLIVYKGQNNVASYSTGRNWAYFFQRVTGVVALIFVLVHVSTTRLSTIFFGHEITFQTMQDKLGNPLWFWFYMIGVLSVVYHFANGVWNFLVTWGITVSDKSQKAMAAVMMVCFVVMAAWSVRILLVFV